MPASSTTTEPLSQLIASGRERAITADVAVKHHAFRRNDRAPNRAFIYRVMSKGTRGVVLESCWSGGQRVTSVEAIGRFHTALNDPDRQPRRAFSTDTPRRESAVARRAHSSALAELQRAGLA